MGNIDATDDAEGLHHLDTLVFQAAQCKYVGYRPPNPPDGDRCLCHCSMPSTIKARSSGVVSVINSLYVLKPVSRRISTIPAPFRVAKFFYPLQSFVPVGLDGGHDLAKRVHESGETPAVRSGLLDSVGDGLATLDG